MAVNPPIDQVVASLNRIEGQVRGIKKMYETKRECEAIVQQIAAARSALKRVAEVMLTEVAVKCGKDTSTRAEIKKVIEHLVKIS